MDKELHTGRVFGCFDDAIGVSRDNPPCACGYTSRRTRKNDGESHFFSCPVGRCGWNLTDYTLESNPLPGVSASPTPSCGQATVDTLSSLLQSVALQPNLSPPRVSSPAEAAIRYNTISMSIQGPATSIASPCAPATTASLAGDGLFESTLKGFTGPSIPARLPTQSGSPAVVWSSTSGAQAAGPVAQSSSRMASGVFGATTLASTSQSGTPTPSNTFRFGTADGFESTAPKFGFTAGGFGWAAGFGSTPFAFRPTTAGSRFTSTGFTPQRSVPTTRELFGSMTAASTTQSSIPAGGFLESNPPFSIPTTGRLFGWPTPSRIPEAGGLFGSTTSASTTPFNPPAGGLFGSNPPVATGQENNADYASDEPPDTLEWLSDECEDLASTGLCNDCGGLNLEAKFHRAYDLYEGARRGENTRKLKVYRSYHDGPPYLADFYYVTSLGNRLSHHSTCQLCNFLRTTIPNPESGTYKILVFCSTESYIFEPPQNDKRGSRPWGQWDHNVFMAVVPDVPGVPKTGVPLRWFETDLPRSGSIYRLTEPEELEYDTRVTLPYPLDLEVDWSLLDYWLGCCRDLHQFCTPKKPAGASLPGFRAINCTKSPPVVEVRPWAESYVALNYVWGPSVEEWPPTILDAVEVTKRLGEKYLWVDRLCIDQSNQEEKQFLISKMDAIYEGAEFTIIAASGDARIGLPGVGKTPRAKQPAIGLRKERTWPSEFGYYDGEGVYEDYDDEALTLLGITEKELLERSEDDEWLDIHRHGFRSRDRPDFVETMKELRLCQKYNISHEHFRIFQVFADELNRPIDEWMVAMEEESRKTQIPLQELAPHILRELSTSAGIPPDIITTAEDIPRVVTPSSKPKAGLPKIADDYVILVSSMEDPRITIRDSEWATRGWTYQEGMLPKRRLVFTAKQAYWECCGMAVHESLQLPLSLLYRTDNNQMPDWCLSGVLDGDIHHVPELQYGFKPVHAQEVFEQIVKLDGHIKAFTSRNLSHPSDSYNAFLGVAARYSVDDGLALILGMPVWTGTLANGRRALDITFALSISTWAHEAKCKETVPGLYTADCARRDQFPSWTWVGWEGTASFGTSAHAEDDPTEPFSWSNGLHVDLFEAMTNKGWNDQAHRGVWCADMAFHSRDGGDSAPLTGWESVRNMVVDQGKKWLLKIRKPLILRAEHLTQVDMEGERKMELHSSVPMTIGELEMDSRDRRVIAVLLFVASVTRTFDGALRFLLFRKVDNGGKDSCWERVGRLAVTIEEWAMNKWKRIADFIAALPVDRFEEDIVVI
ncbi:hypothetical protein MFIFM68171_08213 [Madurella fahalii]|uniref:Heterokaryon incompatibility domain-containing protein n=1 Tax=Madurella fahalii TaxID=1157608 RepID=A0ABQ0GJT4_9PEZI